MRKILLSLLPVLFALPAAAFERPVSMEYEKPVKIDPGFLGSKYRQEGKVLDIKSLMEGVDKVPEARSDVTGAKVWMYSGLITGGVGGFLIGYFGVAPLLGRDFEPIPFGIGVGLAATSLVCSKLGDNRLTKAVEKYNASLAAEGLGIDWNVSPAGSNVAVRLRF